MQISFTQKDDINSNNNVGVFFVSEDLDFSYNFEKYPSQNEVKQLFKIRKNFTAKKGQVLNFIPSNSLSFKQIIIVGLGKQQDLDNPTIQFVGAKLVDHLNDFQLEEATICINTNAKIDSINFSKNLYEGMRIRNYKFIKYFCAKEESNKLYLKKIAFCTENNAACSSAIEQVNSVIDGVDFARDLVSEPPNVLYPETFSKECKKLEEFGIKVKVLDAKEMKKLGMNALLGVAQGSEKEPFLVIMQWLGGNKEDQPISFIGKGVTFDSGGISLKPGLNMGDMKYDMAGAAAVVGAMMALAKRKACVNAIGVIGLVENMPSGNAQRPGDVVKSMSGQTIEIDNTDAEGRLVLADAIWYTAEHYNPKIIINLATLTGAMVVALGEGCYSGLFSNDDDLAKEIYQAGLNSDDKVWRFPLHDYFDKQINSLIADMRNTGKGRGAGSITAAQFLKRFVKNRAWAHLDIAGMAWDKDGSNVFPAGATGYGVRLLNQLSMDYYENSK